MSPHDADDVKPVPDPELDDSIPKTAPIARRIVAPVGYQASSGRTPAVPSPEPIVQQGVDEDRVRLRGSHPGDRHIRKSHRAADAVPAPPRPPVVKRAPSAVSTRLSNWMLSGEVREMEGAHEQPGTHRTHPWWRVMCLTGVDYFSTLGYQPGIAALAAGMLSPIATLVLVLLTLFGALPMYRRVARLSPHGEGSIAMLERLLSWWTGKLFVLALLGFAATDFVITMTLSAADATAHAVENPFFPAALSGRTVLVTLALLMALAAVFLKGFKEAIGIAVGLVTTYLALNAVVMVVGIVHIIENPIVISNWRAQLLVEHSSPLAMLGAALILFPKLALGLSGFETGVAVMPLVKGDPSDTEANPVGRIRNTQKLLLTAAVIMSVFLLLSSFVTITLIPFQEFRPGGKANGRALAFLAHEYLGEGFGTIYDLVTIGILWFAGASAMAGLLNLVPRYLPRYGMAPTWARATRPLVLVISAIAFAVTIIFQADVDAQGGAYATGVLVLMVSAAFAVTLAAWRERPRYAGYAFAVIATIFVYTTVVNIFERPDGVKIAAFFITAIVTTSLVSRVWRSTELRVPQIVVDDTARRLIAEASEGDAIHIIANHPDERNSREYLLKEREQREDNNIPYGAPVLFLEVTVSDASEFAPTLNVRGEVVGRYRILRTNGASVANAIAAILLWLRDETGKRPHIYFGWTEGNPLKYLAKYILFGEGDIAPLTHEVLRRAEADPAKRPAIHLG